MSIYIYLTLYSCGPFYKIVDYTGCNCGSAVTSFVLVVLAATVATIIASIISSILTYCCCVKKKHKKRESVREQRDIYETVEQVKTHEEVEIQQSPAYGVVILKKQDL